MFNLFNKKDKEVVGEKPKDYISDISGYRMEVFKPILGGHLSQGFTAYRSWSGELPTRFSHWIKISTSDRSEQKKYEEQLLGLGYKPYHRNNDIYEKNVGLDRVWEDLNSLS